MSDLTDAVRRRLIGAGSEPTAAQVAAALRAEERMLGGVEVLTLAAEVRADLIDEMVSG